jgi:hypothetical protein
MRPKPARRAGGLRLDVTARGYRFAITDTTDPSGFSVVSNERGLILEAETIR